MGILAGFRVTRKGQKFGNEIADSMGISWGLFHSSLEASGVTMHNVALATYRDEGMSVSEVRVLISPLLLEGLNALESKWGTQAKIENARERIAFYFDTLPESQTESSRKEYASDEGDGIVLGLTHEIDRTAAYHFGQMLAKQLLSGLLQKGEFIPLSKITDVIAEKESNLAPYAEEGFFETLQAEEIISLQVDDETILVHRNYVDNVVNKLETFAKADGISLKIQKNDKII